MTEAPVPVRLHGLLRGDDVAGPAVLAVADDRLTLAGDALRRPLELRFVELDGLALAAPPGRGPVLTLFPAEGDVLEAEGDHRLPAAHAAIEARATRFPELTRALRAVGARRGAPGEEHDRLFAPLLEARARAERAPGWRAQVEAFAPDVLRAAWADALAGFATLRHPASPPDRRALEAALAETMESAESCLGRLQRAADALLADGDAVRLRRWRAWLDEVARLFGEADRCWLAALRELGEAPPAAAAAPPRPGLWQRLRGGGDGGRAR